MTQFACTLPNCAWSLEPFTVQLLRVGTGPRLVRIRYYMEQGSNRRAKEEVSAARDERHKERL
jgi:hypothetical protein